MPEKKKDLRPSGDLKWLFTIWGRVDFFWGPTSLFFSFFFLLILFLMHAQIARKPYWLLENDTIYLHQVIPNSFSISITELVNTTNEHVLFQQNTSTLLVFITCGSHGKMSTMDSIAIVSHYSISNQGKQCLELTFFLFLLLDHPWQKGQAQIPRLWWIRLRHFVGGMDKVDAQNTSVQAYDGDLLWNKPNK